MKTYISDIIPRIQRFSQKLDNLTLLTNQHWVVINDIDNTRLVYIFRANKELLISQNGRVERAKWEYLDSNSLLIDCQNESLLFRHGFLDENILALKIDGKEEYAFLVNETKFEKVLNSSGVIAFLNKTYIGANIKRDIQVGDGGSAKKSELSYIAPNFKLEQRFTFWGSQVEKILVEFEDGLKGYVYNKPSTKQAFFIDSISAGVRLDHYYIDVGFCINSLHSYLKTGRMLKEGLIATYSS